MNGIYAKTGLVTFSGPHYSSFGMKKGFDYTWENFKKILLSDGKNQIIPAAEWSDDLWFINQEQRQFIKNEGHWLLHNGQAQGTIIGGNLGTFTLLLGSEYRPVFRDDTILFLEDCYSSAADDKAFLRNLQALVYQPDFAKVKGLVIGRFQKASNITREKLEYIVESMLPLTNLPIIANVDFGHTTPLLTLPIGGSAKIDGTKIMINV